MLGGIWCIYLANNVQFFRAVFETLIKNNAIEISNTNNPAPPLNKMLKIAENALYSAVEFS